MKRLPAVAKLADEIRGTGKDSPEKSAAYLLAKRKELQTYQGIDVLAMYSDPEYAPGGTTANEIKKAKALIHHFTHVRSAIAKALWSREIFIGIDVIDELIFYGARDNKREGPHPRVSDAHS